MQVLRWAVFIAAMAPMLSALGVGMLLLSRARWPSETLVSRLVMTGLLASVVVSLAASACALRGFGSGASGNTGYGDRLSMGNYSVPVVALVHGIALAFSLLAAALSALVACLHCNAASWMTGRRRA